MPHLIAEHFCPIHTPCEKNGIKFVFIGSEAEGKSGVVGAEANGSRFLLRWYPHKKGAIIKVDKTTRPPLLNTVKRSLTALCECANANVIAGHLPANNNDQYDGYINDPAAFIDTIDQPLWIEVGFGSGRNMIFNAANTPDVIHLGIELHRPSAEQLLNRARAEKLPNIRVMIGDARAILQMMPARCAARILVHFPIPWDDSPKRRVFNADFAGEALRALCRGGSLELRTDSKSYYENAVEMLGKFDDITVEKRENCASDITSKYEARWQKMGRDIYDVIVTNNAERIYDALACDFDFDQSVAPQVITDKIAELFEINDNFIIKTREVFYLSNGGFICQIVFGSLPQIIYLLCVNDRVSYYPIKPYLSANNILAHQALSRILYAK
ncbi:tRNA (guanine-N(7)-)-methyltransferase [Campylobacterota bacterium]|nr:tRNA (guanine-N(7)-)-methyltransferase [Campylobacterota bacterium]